MNVTKKQLISLFLMTATMAIVLSLLPEQSAGHVESQTITQLTSK